jgi:acetyl-CoA carboxylase biotin carboxyl carrier protein
VMLIEAMKTYNPIRATTGGKVLQILVGDSMPVEFGEELLLVE